MAWRSHQGPRKLIGRAEEANPTGEGRRHNRKTNHLQEEINLLADVSCPLDIISVVSCWINHAEGWKKKTHFPSE